MTGPIGCGKSTIAGWLGERPGVVVIDADRVARDVLDRGEPALGGRRGALRRGADRQHGELDRAALGRLVFADPAALADLEAIVHPAVRPRILAAIARAESAGRLRGRHRGDQARRGRTGGRMRRGLAGDLRPGRPAGAAHGSRGVRREERRSADRGAGRTSPRASVRSQRGSSTRRATRHRTRRLVEAAFEAALVEHRRGELRLARSLTAGRGSAQNTCSVRARSW